MYVYIYMYIYMYVHKYIYIYMSEMGKIARKGEVAVLRDCSATTSLQMGAGK